jgi:hypothetical protein
MRVILDFYYDDLEQRCLNPKCSFKVGPYSEEWHGNCPGYILEDNAPCRGRLGFFRAFGTERERSVQVDRWDARVSGRDY